MKTHMRGSRMVGSSLSLAAIAGLISGCSSANQSATIANVEAQKIAVASETPVTSDDPAGCSEWPWAVLNPQYRDLNPSIPEERDILNNGYHATVALLRMYSDTQSQKAHHYGVIAIDDGNWMSDGVWESVSGEPWGIDGFVCVLEITDAIEPAYDPANPDYNSAASFKRFPIGTVFVFEHLGYPGVLRLRFIDGEALESPTDFMVDTVELAAMQLFADPDGPWWNAWLRWDMEGYVPENGAFTEPERLPQDPAGYGQSDEEPTNPATDEAVTAAELLEDQLDFDAERAADMTGSWVVSFSAKKPGLIADGITWSYDYILAQAAEIAQYYPVILVDGTATENLSAEWILTVLDQTFDNEDQAQAWCDSEGLNADNCNPFQKVH